MPEHEEKTAYPEPPKLAFVDAYGDTGLDVEKAGATGSFIVAAVLVDGHREAEVRAAADVIRAKHFGPGPIKSKKASDQKRLHVLSDLAGLDFRFVGIAIDKSKVPRDGGLLFPGSFIKFMHSKLFDRLYERHPDLRIVSDRTGSPEFMEGFQKYVLTQRPLDLFKRASFDFDGSRDDPLIQVADFIAGSLARLYDAKKSVSNSEAVHEALRLKALWVIDWPKRFRSPPAPIRAGSEFEDQVRSYCLDRVHDYLRKHEHTRDSEITACVEALRYLLWWYETAGEAEWIPTGQLRDYLRELRLDPPNVHQFRLKVIAALRDSRVVVASSSKGYKIPASVSDVLDFVERTSGIVVPMLDRLASVREALLDVTEGGLDVLDGQRFERLREVLDRREFGRAAPPAAPKRTG